MKGLEEEYSDKELRVIWIGFQDTPGKLRAYAEKLKIDRVGFDHKKKVAKKYAVGFGAGVILIDSSGNVRRRMDRGFKMEDLRSEIEQL